MDANILDTLDPRGLGEELQRARKRHGMTQEKAAKVMNVSRTTIVAIEKGERRIKAGELLKLARAYGRPVNDFVGTRPKVEPFEVQFRGPFLRTEEDARDVEPYILEFEELCRDYLQLEQMLRAPLNRKYPSEYPVQGLPYDQAAENTALDERNRLGLGDGPIPALRDILEQDVGLRVFYIALPSRFSEMYVFTDPLGGCMAINQNHPEERRRWSMAHAYAHFLTSRYKPFMSTEIRPSRVPESERFADSFSAFFLMPTSGLTRRFHDLQRMKEKVTLGDICTLAHFYGVSLEAILRRLESIRLVKSGIADTVRQDGFQVNEARKQLGLSEIGGRGGLFPTRYQYLALDVLEQGLIGEGQFARFMRVDRLEARRVAKTLREETANLSDDRSTLQNLASPITV